MPVIFKGNIERHVSRHNKRVIRGNIGLLACSAALLACRASPTTVAVDLPHVNATRSCAPTDGPAVSITWTAAPATGRDVVGPYLQVLLWTGVGELAGRSFRLATDSQDGFARFVRAGGGEGAVRGSVRITQVGADSSVSGAVDLALDDGSRFARSFVAPWISTQMLCG